MPRDVHSTNLSVSEEEKYLKRRLRYCYHFCTDTDFLRTYPLVYSGFLSCQSPSTRLHYGLYTFALPMLQSRRSV